MIPLLPDFSSAMAPQAMPQPGGSASRGGNGGLDFAGLLDVALPRAPTSLLDAASPDAPAGPVQMAKVIAAPAPSLPPGTLPELQPLLQAQPQTKTNTKSQSKAEPQAEPSTVSLAAPGAVPLGSVPMPPGGTPLPPSGAIVPGAAFTKPAVSDLPQPDAAPLPTLWVNPVLQEKQLAEISDAPVATANIAVSFVKVGAEAPEAVPAPEVVAPAATTKLASTPPAPQAPIALPPSVLPSPLPLTKGALTPPVSRLAPETDAPALDAGLAEPSLSDPSSATATATATAPTPTPTPTTARLSSPALSDAPLTEAPAQAERAVIASLTPTAVPAPIQPPIVGVARRGVNVQSEAASAPGPVPQFTPEPPVAAPAASPIVPFAPSAPSSPVIAARAEVVGDAPRAAAPAPIAPASLAAHAQRPGPHTKDISKVVTTSPSGVAEPATSPLTPLTAAPASEAAPPPPSLASSPVQAPATAPPAAVPAAPVIVAAPELSAPSEPARTAPSPQLEQTITAVGDLREAMRAARPQMTLPHAEFGAVSLRLEATGAQDWRVVLASRDPGFVPAIQAALGERAVAAAAETSLAGNGGQSGSGEPRYGSSLGSGQGGSQPYSGQSHSRDEGGLAHHQQQRQQRGSGTPAAADAGSQAGDGDLRERGLFA